MSSSFQRNKDDAPGQPGIEPRWTSSAKSGVGTAVAPASQVWFTVSHGVLNEIYSPEVDRACTRDMEFIVTDGKEFFSEEKRHTKHRTEYLAPGVPAFRLTNECREGRYRIEKEIVTDPRLDVLLMRTRFTPLQDGELYLYLLLAPHLEDGGAHNSAWLDRFWGQDFLLAQRNGCALALGCSAPFLKSSAGYVGVSDGWQDLHEHKRMTWSYGRAKDGNVALTAQIDLQNCGGEFVLALGFDSSPVGAAHHVRGSLLDGFDSSLDNYVSGWRKWHDCLRPPPQKKGENDFDYYRISTAVLRTHQAKNFPGGTVASLSIPWGFSKGDEDRGGYHLAWVRDLAQVSGALLAAGAGPSAGQVLRYLAVTQKEEGCWPQNMWVSGVPYWSGIQMDECAFPILLTATSLREKLIDEDELKRLWPMVEKALGYVVRQGPSTEQDRWEEVGGYSPYTIAVQIAALLEAAEFSPEPELAGYLRETADSWNESIERWTYATGTRLAKKCEVEGYYVRIAPLTNKGGSVTGEIQLKNVKEQTSVPASSIISVDALALVRFGLRAPDDPRISNTVRVIDALLKVETPFGPAWHRYNHDGYGEHEDGAPFDGTGIGRAWPLLTGERAHFELAAGRHEEALRLLKTITAFTSDGGMIPEQIWDAPDIPERSLYFGHPSGSGMPLVWAHAEYIKLARSIRDGRIFDMPPVTAERYLVEKKRAAFASWRFNDQIDSLGKEKNLRFEVLAPAIVHWSSDNWMTAHDLRTRDTKLGVHVADLGRDQLGGADRIEFAFHWPEANRWEGRNFQIAL
ncbi:MAG TPA: glycoside hydrolase family 15 protein [Chthoniobacterales bacterium]